MHAARIRVKGEPGTVLPLNSQRPKVCTVVGCSRSVESRGLCAMHYKRLTTTGEVGPADPILTKQDAACSVADCGRPPLARGWCSLHYGRWHATGDPLAVRPRNTQNAASRRRVAVDQAEAASRARMKGLEPLEPCPGLWKGVWRCRVLACGHEVAPQYGALLRHDRPYECPVCKCPTPEEAVEVMRRNGLEPLAPYPGSQLPWPSSCTGCGREVRPRYSGILRGKGGCRHCAARRNGDRLMAPKAAEAAERMRASGAEPLVPYPGHLKPWLCRCSTCRRDITPIHANVAKGQRACAFCAGARVDPRVADDAMRAVGLEPVAPFPGADQPWPSTCTACGGFNATSRYVTAVRGHGCAWCAGNRVDPTEVAESVRALGGEPLEPYPGATRPWAIRHRCGRLVSPNWSHIRNRGHIPCPKCSRYGLDPELPSLVYLIAHDSFHAYKIGIANAETPRLQQHQAHGWRIVRVWAQPDGRTARNVERAVIRAWRAAGIPDAVPADDMPQGGWTETAPMARVTLEEVALVVESASLSRP